MVVASRRVMPLLFALEGVSHHSFLLDLNGSERLLFAFCLASIKTRSFKNVSCMVSCVGQVLATFFLGMSRPIFQWCILIAGLSVQPGAGQGSARSQPGRHLEAAVQPASAPAQPTAGPSRMKRGAGAKRGPGRRRV